MFFIVQNKNYRSCLDIHLSNQNKFLCMRSHNYLHKEYHTCLYM